MKGLLMCVATLALGLATMTIEASALPPTPDAAYEALARSYFHTLLAENPSQATDAGLHDYDDRLDDLSPAHFAAQLKRDDQYLTKLEAIAPRSLSPEVRIDRQILMYALLEDKLTTGVEAQWRHNPDIYSQTVSDAVYQIIAHDYAPPPKRMQYLIARERQIPGLLSQGEQNTTTVDAATAEVSFEDTAGSADFFESDVPAAFANVKDPALRSRFEAANGAAVSALRAYAQWIQHGPLAHPKGTFAIGREAYQKRLLYDDAVTMPVSQYLAIGESALRATQAQFAAVARRIDPKHTAQEVYASLRLTHPARQDLVHVANQDVSRLRDFVVSHRIVTLPPDADVAVVETPAFARSTTFAAFRPPGVFEKVATKSYYWVTPPNPAWPKQRQQELLGALNDFERPIISAHEIMPGHFVNFAIDRHLHLSLTRKLLFSPEFAEGWAHYDEQMVVDEGWANNDPRVRLGQLAGALTRECRYVVGVKEHTQGMTVEQATRFLMANAHLVAPRARQEALRGTQDPMYGYYTLGKMMILKLRADYQKKMGSRYTLQGFHDALLAHGDPPLPLLRPILLGGDDDGKPL